jgi:UDP-N-acetylmuramate: L-alanyl-gamma-D-glutamyl-meso-diaminopimelate ligase
MARHYHLIGIGGTAMASLAGLLQAAGHTVTGSDEAVYPPMSDQLRGLGIAYREGYRPENLEPRPDIVIVGNAISRGNAELEFMLNEKLPYTSAAATIKEEFLRGRVSIPVAGTHGKTTTTSLLAWLLECAGINPSFLIGGVAENFGTSFRLTDSSIFVIEADEYDTAYFDKGPKMWHYLPDIAIVNNIEFDHADIYRDDIAYRWAFSRFINLIPSNGTLVAGWDSPIARELATASLAPIESFGFEGGSSDARDSASSASGAELTDALSGSKTHPRWAARDVSFGEEETRFTVLHDGEEWGQVAMPLAGAFNVRNALAAIAAAVATGANAAGIREGLRTFRSVRRRLEVRGTADGVTVIDDFAHHPTAVRETILAARQRWPARRMVAIFEPRSYTAQRREFQDAYRDALALADEIVIAGLFHPERYTKESAIDPQVMVEEWRSLGKVADSIPEPDRIAATIGARARPGDLVLVMSNGGFGGVHGKLLAALEARTKHG